MSRLGAADPNPESGADGTGFHGGHPDGCERPESPVPKAWSDAGAASRAGIRDRVHHPDVAI